MKFIVENPDYSLSPLTGMSRKHWQQCARFLVDGVFQSIADANEPILLPKQSEVTYPQPNDPEHRVQAARFEGLARTLMAAAPIIEEDPTYKSNGICIRDYYAEHILRACDPRSEQFVGSLEQITKEHGKKQYQQTVECGALVLGLMQSRGAIWDTYAASEKAIIAAFLSAYGHGLTIGHNWRFFNVLMLTFLRMNGFPIDQRVLMDHLQHILALHSGDGWYSDDPCFDLYNPWGYHFYGMLWCRWYGYENEPEIARIISNRNETFIKSWIRFYSRKGNQMSWGRSLIYRFACSAALGAHFMSDNPAIEPGFARRLASGNIMQFLGREELFHAGVPCLGYYGPFDPMIQFYSCSASPFWVAKIFVALSLGADSPFWTASESEGFWKDLGDGTAVESIEGPGVLIVNRGKEGTSELFSGKVPQSASYYNQLFFNSDFCYQEAAEAGANGATFSVRSLDQEGFHTPLSIGYSRYEDGVLYRVLNMKSGVGPNSMTTYTVNLGPERIDTADIVIPGGVVRVDRVRLPYQNELHLGHYGLPHIGGKSPTFEEKIVDGYRYVCGRIEDGRRLAFVAVAGWDGVSVAKHGSGLCPESEESSVIYAFRTDHAAYGGMGLFISVLLHRTDGEDWTPDELMPICEFKIIPLAPSGQPMGALIKLKTGDKFMVDYGDLEGNLRGWC